MTTRPGTAQKQSYQSTPAPLIHKADEDLLAILVCQIKIWEPEGVNWFAKPSPSSCLIIRECESIEITDSAKELLNKAVVRFPRGTVIHKSGNKQKKVTTGEKTDLTDKKEEMQKATNDGELLTSNTRTFSEDGVSTTSVATNYDDKGLVEFNRSKKEAALLSQNDVAIGNRIEIRLGYAYSETEFQEMSRNVDDRRLQICFTGFITSISASTPLELECTNMAHVLTCVSTPNISPSEKITVKDFLDTGGKWDLLDGTGIPLAPCSQKLDITVSGAAISENLTVADVLYEWGKAGILSMMELLPDGSVQLRVGWAYYAGLGGGTLPNDDKRYITYTGGDNSVIILQSDWDVAQDKLSLKHVDKKYLAVEARGKIENKWFKLTLRRKADNDDEGWMIDNEQQFDIVNERTPQPRKKTKYIEGQKSTITIKGKLKNKVDMKKYEVIPYVSITFNVSRETLIQEAKQYWAKYVPNGISGSLEIFGDVMVRPTNMIGLIDLRNPEKNGYYYVEQVNTSFGVNGYRRELKIPYKIAAFQDNVKIIK